MAGGTQQSFRKALGALKDTTSVGFAKINNEYKELDIAILKATNHVERLAKEKYIRAIFDAVSASRPRADVAYCIFGLARRLSKTHNWAVALKTLIVIHRALREVDSTFREELINYSRNKGHMLNVSHFKDNSSPNAWDYSAWVRVYALYLEERLECFRILNYDVETDRSRTRDLDTPDLLEKLPALQQLLFRLLACKPDGATVYNSVIQYTLALVSKESVSLYAAINNAILNLVDKFFEMQQHDAVRALGIYKTAGNQAEKLSEFYETCRGFELGREQKFINIEQPPESFLTAMEEYVKEAPRSLMLQWNVGNDDRGTRPKSLSQPVLSIKEKSETDVEEDSEASVTQPEELSETPGTQPITDLLGLDELRQDASELDEKNVHALTGVSSVNPSNAANTLSHPAESAGWELAFVTIPSSNETAVADSKLAGGFDKLTLDSLYDDAMARRMNQNGTYHTGQGVPNPFEAAQYTEDPFYASNGVAPPINVQMATMAPQHQAFMMQQQPVIGQDPTNPFGNPYFAQDKLTYPPQNSYNGLI